MTHSSLPLCVNASDLRATYNTIINLFHHHHAGVCQCPRRCTEILYNTVWDVKKQHPQGATVMHITIPDDSIEVFAERYAYTFVRLLCDLGGTLGLFLGFCVLTILELLEATFRLASVRVKVWKNGTNKVQRQEEYKKSSAYKIVRIYQ